MPHGSLPKVNLSKSYSFANFILQLQINTMMGFIYKDKKSVDKSTSSEHNQQHLNIYDIIDMNFSKASDKSSSNGHGGGTETSEHKIGTAKNEIIESTNGRCSITNASIFASSSGP